ncbi:MAG: acyloxyacyl hydrolase [Alphaproteobacteria bacterium]
MKKTTFAILSIFIPALCFADDSLQICDPNMRNPFTGTYRHQFAFGIGQGFDTGIIVPPPTRLVPFYIGTVQYSQPTTFFRIPARRSINISETLGLGEKYGWKWQDYTIPMAYVTEDIALFRWNRLYGGVGAGVGLQAKQNKRLGAKLLFQFKITFGYNISKEWALEFFVQHFSNANTSEDNHSYAFYGLGATYNF